MNLVNLSDYLRKLYLRLSNKKKIKVLLRWSRINLHLLLPSNSSEQIKCLHKQLINDSSWNVDFILCTIFSCLIASFGLLSNSSAVIIGAMLIAPLMLPLRGLAFSACEGDFKLFRTAILSIIGATLISLFLSSLIAKIVSFSDLGSEVIARTQPNLIDLGIAVTAGAMSGFGKVRTGISDTLAGTAIAVALMPPLCVVGISLAMGNYPFATGAFLLYSTNLLGITLACMIAFIFTGYTKINHAVGWTSLLTFFLVIPLGTSFFRLLNQQKVEMAIRNSLINETYTVGQDVENVVVKVVWTTKKPTVYVTLQTEKEITAKQVELTERYLDRRFKKDFKLVLLILPLTRITVEKDEVINEPIIIPEQNLFNEIKKNEIEDNEIEDEDNDDNSQEIEFIPQDPSPQ